jgi:hypothetical protein
MKETIHHLTGRFFSLAIFLLVLTLTACKKDDNNMEESLRCPVAAVDGVDDSVLGKWRLVKARIVFRDPRTEDYSCEGILYDFRADGTLTVSGGSSVDAPGYEEGQYTYTFTAGKLFEHLEEAYTLSINDSKFASGINDNRLVLNASPLDGPILYLVRVQ